MHKIKLTALTAIAMTMVVQVPLSAGEDVLYVNGKITDQQNNPVAGAKICLRDKGSGKRMLVQANGRGDFQLKHPPTTTESLEVIPPANAGLAQAFLDNISGEHTKHVIVKLKKGFAISGRITANGKGLKGLIVQAVPELKPGQSISDTIHGGGKTITDGGGNFHLTLTPGPKKLELTNPRYAELATSLTQDLTVTSDLVIPDIDLPKATPN